MMINFIDFADRLRQYDPILVEGIISGYKAIFEAESINKQYLIKEAGGQDKLQSSKNRVDSVWGSTHMDTYIKRKDKILPFLYLQEIRKPGVVNDKIMEFLHDLSSAGKLNTLDKLNSDTTPDQFIEFVSVGIKALKNLGNLDEDEEKTWLRVRVFHDFGDGFQWIVALDEDGNVSGFMPSCVTQKVAAHCGNEPSAQEGDEYFELRKNNKPYITVIINDGKIEESKSYGNRKNTETEKVLPYLKWLFKHEKITGVGQRYDYGYSPDTNMGIKDFLGIDDDFVEEVERDKPNLLGNTERKIITFKRNLKSGLMSVDDVMRAFIHKNIKLHELRGILGRIPFTDEQIVDLVKKDILSSNDIMQTDIKLLTYPVQHAFIEKGRDGFLMDLHRENPSIDIDLDSIPDGRSGELESAVKSGDIESVKKLTSSARFSVSNLASSIEDTCSIMRYAKRKGKTDLIDNINEMVDVLLDKIGELPPFYINRLMGSASAHGYLDLMKKLITEYPMALPSDNMDTALKGAISGFIGYGPNGGIQETLKFICDSGKCSKGELHRAYNSLKYNNTVENSDEEIMAYESMKKYIASKIQSDKEA